MRARAAEATRIPAVKIAKPSTVKLSTAKTSTAKAATSTSATTAAAPGLRFNFHNVPLDTVLDYLGKAAGFTIIRDVAVTGRLEAVSQQPLSRAQAVDLLNTVLRQRGYAAIRTGDILKIVALDEARKRDIPVQVGRDSAKIVKSDSLVTQVIPVRYAQASQLTPNLSGLLESYAVMTVDASSNSIVLTATQTDIRRMLQIIEALDRAASAGSAIKVFRLKYGDAAGLASVINDLFKTESSASASGGGNGPFNGPPPPPMMMGPEAMGGEAANASSSDAVRKAAAQTNAVSDERSNTLVVSADAGLMPRIEELVRRLDVAKVRVREIQIFPLRYADAQDMADLINEVYQQSSSSGSASSSSNGSAAARSMMFGGPPGAGGPGGGGGMPGMGGPGGGGFPGGGGPMDDSPAPDASQYASSVAVAEVRTNSVIINAEKKLLDQIAPLIAKLDSDPAKDKKVFVYPMKYADAQQTAAILQGMFQTDSTQGSQSLTSQDAFVNDNPLSSNSSNSQSNSSTSVVGGSSGGSVPTGMSQR